MFNFYSINRAAIYCIMATEVDHKLYEKILDMMLVLRDLQEEFKTYSANDIKKLIAAKLKNKREPAPLQELYRLEAMITELRQTFTVAKDEYLNSRIETMHVPERL